MTHRRGVRSAIADGALTLAAIGGALCLVLVALSFAFGISLILFKTGSMSPTIPAGSLAVVREIPAAEIEVGDVVTVDRDDVLPVTHRVTDVTVDGETATFTMQGDANDVADPEPYTATSVRLVLWSAPGLAVLIVWFQQPLVLGLITVAASAVVTWAFWPRERDGEHVRDPETVESGGDGADDVDADAVEPARQRGSGRHAAALAAGAMLLGGALALQPASPAPASPSTQTIAGEHLTLTSIGDAERMRSLATGETVEWVVGISADAPEPGTIDVAISGTADETFALDVAIAACSVAWVDDACSGSVEQLRADAPFAFGQGDAALTSFPTTDDRWLRIDVTLGDEAVGAGSLTLRVDAAGDSLVAGSDSLGALPATGVDRAWRLLPLAGLAVVTGLLVAGIARMRRRR